MDIQNIKNNEKKNLMEKLKNIRAQRTISITMNQIEYLELSGLKLSGFVRAAIDDFIVKNGFNPKEPIIDQWLKNSETPPHHPPVIRNI